MAARDPHFAILFFLWIALIATSVVALFAILFTGRYPRSLFGFNVGVLPRSNPSATRAVPRRATRQALRLSALALTRRCDDPGHARGVSTRRAAVVRTVTARSVPNSAHAVPRHGAARGAVSNRGLRMGITTHSEPNPREALLTKMFARKANDMRPEPENRPLQSVSTDTAPDASNESADQATGRRLGRVEYLLLTLIALGVAITIAMAVVDPSG
jgi:hypothetical protein